MKRLSLALGTSLLLSAFDMHAAKPAKASAEKKASNNGIIDIKSEAEFTRALSKNGTYAVKFSTPTCPACKQMAPAFEKVAQDMGDQVTFLTVDTSKPALHDLARTFNITGVPTTFFITKKVGGMHEDTLRNEVLNSLGKGHLPRSTEKAEPIVPAKKK